MTPGKPLTPEDIESNWRTYFGESLLPESPRPDRSRATSSGSTVDIEAFISKHGIKVLRRVPWDGGGGDKWILEECIFNSEHSGGGAVITQVNGVPGYKCQHNSCSGLGWIEMRERLEPGYRQRWNGNSDGTSSAEEPPPFGMDAEDIGGIGEPEPEANKPRPRNGANGRVKPEVVTADELRALEIPPRQDLVEGIIPTPGATMIYGPAKSTKTLVSAQIGIAVAANQAVFGYYRVLQSGAVLMVEQDDPAGKESVKEILERSRVSTVGIPFFLVPKVSFSFGLDFIDWLEREIRERSIKLVILDSYTALRAARGSGIDVVKIEQTDMNLLDMLAKRTGCSILVIHHSSKGSAAMDWSEKAAGSFAMSAAVEGLIHISRFNELDSNAPERLVRVRGRHVGGTDIVLKFCKESLDHEHVVEGGSAPFYPLLLQIQDAFEGRSFWPKELSQATGVSRATAGRQIDRLYRSNALRKRGFGEYVLVAL